MGNISKFRLIAIITQKILLIACVFCTEIICIIFSIILKEKYANLLVLFE